MKGKGINYPEEEGFILDFPDTDVIFDRFDKQGVFTRDQVKSSLKNTLIMDDFEDINLNRDVKMPSIYPDLSHKEKVSKLKSIITDEWREDKKEIDDKDYPKYLEAIRFETNIIEETEMEDYFLLK